MLFGNRRYSWLARSATIGVVVLGIMAALAYTRYGSLRAALANLRGEPLAVSPAEIDLGTGEKNERRTIHFEIENLSLETATIVGAKCDCSCTIVDGLPLKVPSDEKGRLEMQVLFPDSDGGFSHVVLFYTDVAQQGVLAVKFQGQITK